VAQSEIYGKNKRRKKPDLEENMKNLKNTSRKDSFVEKQV
jgi:hypothetical protein